MKMESLGLRRRVALELNRQLQHCLRREHPLRQLFWESTLRCNVHCRHCGSDCRAQSDTHDMPREDFFRVLDSIALHTNPHDVFVIMGGGEPLMRPDIMECGRGIYERGFPWGMVTNGLALTPERFLGLRRAGIHSITVSLDGLEDAHNWLRCHPDSFRQASQAIDLLVADGHLVYDVVTCVHQRNFGQLAQLRDFLTDKGVTGWRLFPIFPMGRAANNPELQLNGKQFRQLLDFIRQTRKEGRIRAAYSCEGYVGPYEGDVRDWLFRCEAGVTVASILADGSIGACTSIRSNYSQGNIYQDDFMEVWENRYQQHRNREWMRQGPCLDCKHWRYCEGNGMHLRDNDGHLLVCHMQRIENETKQTTN